MEFLQPRSLPEALAAKAERPEAIPIAGGTDVMVELNFDRARPPALLDLTRVPDLREGPTDQRADPRGLLGLRHRSCGAAGGWDHHPGGHPDRLP